jgi:hypothetical protein
MNSLRSILGGALLVCLAALTAPLALTARAARAAAPAEVEPRLAVATSDGARGDCDAVDLDPPWEALHNLEALGPQARLRYFFDLLYAVDPSQDSIQVIDPASFDTLRTIFMERGSSPEDLLVVSADRAFVSLYNRAALAIVDPARAVVRGFIDLSAFADGDGLPEMSMLARDGDLLFVQIQRIDRVVSGGPVPPSWLAVIDLRTESLIDVDPRRPGIQGIELNGTIPSFRMHVEARARRLFVSTPGPRLNVSGGIEEIDLDALASLGFVLSEESVGIDLGGFVMTSPDAGYVLGHTDIVASSHLAPFSRQSGSGQQIMMNFGIIDNLAVDLATSQLFFPDPFSVPFGVHVIDTATHEVLTETPIATGRPPWDLTVIRRTTPGEARELQVTGRDPETGRLSLAYRPACGATNHNIVYGPLDKVGSYAYSGQVCGIGTSGAVEAFDPGEGSIFFLVVGTGEAVDEGSYGGDSRRAERPEDLLDPVCSFAQDLSFSCDR